MGNNKQFMSAGSADNGIVTSIEEIKTSISGIVSTEIPHQNTVINSHTTSKAVEVATTVNNKITEVAGQLDTKITGVINDTNRRFDDIIATISGMESTIAPVATVSTAVSGIDTKVTEVGHHTAKVYEWFKLDDNGGAVGALAQKLQKVVTEVNGLDTEISGLIEKTDRIETNCNTEFAKILSGIVSGSLASTTAADTANTNVVDVLSKLGNFTSENTVSGTLNGLATNVSTLSTTATNIQNDTTQLLNMISPTAISESLSNVLEAENGIKTKVVEMNQSLMDMLSSTDTPSLTKVLNTINDTGEEVSIATKVTNVETKIDAVTAAINAFEAYVGNKEQLEEASILDRLSRIEAAITELKNK